MAEYGIKTIEIGGWEEFPAKVVQNIASLNPNLIFRGQKMSNWELVSSLTRILKEKEKDGSLDTILAKYSMQRKNFVMDHLRTFYMASRGKRESNPPEYEDFDEWWSLGQHHGLATPLLDWTGSPYIALFFAYIEEDDNNEINEFRSVYALDNRELMQCQVKNKLQRDEWIQIIESYSNENKRLVSQSANFTFVGSDYMLSIEDWIKKYAKKNSRRPILYKFNISNKNRIECLKELNRMNINYLTLFPDLTGAALHSNLKLKINNY